MPFSEIGTGPAIWCSSGGKVRSGDQIGDFEMTASTTFAQRLFAGIAAFSMTSFLIVASFSIPSVQIVQGMVA